MSYNILYWCSSHIGKIRTINQDNFVCDGIYVTDGESGPELPLCGTINAKDSSLFGIFDGMGGEECGEIASLIAAKAATTVTLSDNPVSDLTAFCKETNATICDYTADHQITAMGTTAAILAFTTAGVTLCNIGDSKVFRFSESHLEQISQDHVVPGPFGKKPPLSQNLGIPPSELLIEPYVAEGGYQDGDIYLICSDGLTDMVSNTIIEQTLEEEQTPEAAGEKLLQLSLENGGKDNITLILCRIEKEKNHIWELFRKRFRRKEK